ncbi:MAG: Lrp/AsnC family transcriptional regulator [Selenomonadaceae bacterium]|nr:Lrp/AsnC family transcriptional regulator [Selenomonadaceae bacterium]
MVEELSQFDRELLNILQENLPVSPQPFKDVAETLGTSEESVLGALQRLKREGYIRRIGAFFDSEKLGYVGSLIALKVEPQKLDEVANAINKYAGVTHNYEREGKYNLWFTLNSPNESFEKKTIEEIRSLDGVTELLNLKATKKYKVNVAFNL